MIGFHPLDDIVYFAVGWIVAVYSIVDSTIKFCCNRQCFPSDVFPYVHPAHPVVIPQIKNYNMAPSESNNTELAFD